ncbi:two-component system sensor histidine kinase EvgS [Pseudomonas sp. BIGb0408]|uniref:histidine kinase n=1 Tax=Phytopseudomonas flavescens TaxID=29435 RepID=A0A7Y9XI21_9GAMM|nr:MULTISPECIES: transporter substrate-binding domain-containing protein [Pseudomonas]MCW2293661.1 two-component system sensor histidine kinase EvgS [Pseudomonas sp. BIGb0408]NYH71770.1 two-component system sensor histidine kinase EvgS [Pseudomonas flavescens]
MTSGASCTWLGRALCGLCLWVAGAVALAAEVQPETLQLLGRSQAEVQDIQLDEADWRWLRLRHELRLGVSAPDYPPFDISDSGRDYEGLTADYADLIAQLLDTRISVRRYPNRTAALEALSAGEIDLLGSSNQFEVETAGVALSVAYCDDQSVLISRIGESHTAQTLAGRKLAVGYDYLPLSRIEARYPGAIVERYAAEEQAMAAVAFGQADAMFSNANVAQYLIQQNYSNSVRIAQLGQPEAIGYGFALRPDDLVLRRIVDTALAAIPLDQRQSIQKRWSGGQSLNTGGLRLSAAEQRWLARNPVVRVAVDSGLAPLSYVDIDGHYRGSTADLLALIELRSGLKFDIQRKVGIGELLRAVRDGKADMLADSTPDAEREEYLRFSRPYLVNPFVLVTRKQAQALDGLASLNGRKLAIPRGHTLLGELRRNYPQIELLQTGSALEGFTLVRDGVADATVHALSSANYYIRRMYDEQLRVAAAIDLKPSQAAFAVRRSETELQGILDKVLLDIPPDELNALNNRWRTNAVVSTQSWRDYRDLIYQIVAVAVLLLLVSLVWNFYLRRQIKQRLLAKQHLADQLRFMEVLINGTPHPIYVRDRAGRMLICNDSYLQAFAVEREAVIGKTLADSLPAGLDTDKGDTYLDDYRWVMDNGLALIQDRELRIGTRMLTIYHWLLPYQDSHGDVQGIIGGWLDISERQAMLEELQSARERADEANRIKSTFLATMSHEIRTPMSAVLGMLELALKHAEQGQLDRQAIEVAYESAKDMLALIGDILDIARIESGRLGLAPERANLRVLVESVARVFDGVARQKNIGLLLDIDASVSREVLIDPLRFKQVLSNLISNAIKFTDAGQVSVHIHGQAVGEERIAVQLLVEDTGIGISSVDQARLFQPFAQARQNGLSSRHGAGLGLVICRSLCEMMGGRLTLSSTPGQGTRVEVELNLATLEPAALDTQPVREEVPTARSHLRVLVVDDHAANRLLLCQQLAFYGHEVSEASDGASGLAAWSGGHFDLLISDCNMPVMSGYALARAIRSEEQAQGLPPCSILGYTANAQPDERQRCLDSGMNDCLFKPISLVALGERLASIRAIDRAAEAEQGFAEAFDPSALDTLTGGDPALARRLLDELWSSTTEDLRTLQELAATEDRDALAELAHRIKGAARIVSARPLVQRCEALENACRLEPAEAPLQPAIQALAAEMQALCGALERQGARGSGGTL